MKAIIVHGGAGKWKSDNLNKVKDGLIEAVMSGFEELKRGKSAVEACLSAVVSLEDNPLFNAGTGSTLTLDGRCEMDACIMVGSTLEIGAVAAVENIKNPILLAYQVMKETNHVLMIGEGAEKLAWALGFEKYNPITPERLKQWELARKKLLEYPPPERLKKLKELIVTHPELLKGTVGCVVLDDSGEIAAGTSTGGTILKLFGRVGDTPIPGAGTYATEFAGASSTGIGEGIMRVLLAKRATDLIESGEHPMEACKSAIEFLENRVHLEAGVIAIDHKGNIGYAHNSPHMPVAYMREDMESPILDGLPK